MGDHQKTLLCFLINRQTKITVLKFQAAAFVILPIMFYIDNEEILSLRDPRDVTMK